jgi:hypothetical protein
MVPSLPIDLPSRVLLNEIKAPLLECSMLRLDRQCGNSATAAIIYPTQHGCYGLVALCDMCIQDLPDGWLRSLETIADDRPDADEERARERPTQTI